MPGRLIGLFSTVLFATPAAAHPGHILERVAGHDHLATLVMFVVAAFAIVMLAASVISRSRRP